MDQEQRAQRDRLIEQLQGDDPVVLETDPGGHESSPAGGTTTADVDHSNGHPSADVQIPIDAIIGRLGQRIGQLEADLAVAQAHAEAATAELTQARMALLEVQLRDTVAKEDARDG